MNDDYYDKFIVSVTHNVTEADKLLTIYTRKLKNGASGQVKKVPPLQNSIYHKALSTVRPLIAKYKKPKIELFDHFYRDAEKKIKNVPGKKNPVLVKKTAFLLSSLMAWVFLSKEDIKDDLNSCGKLDSLLSTAVEAFAALCLLEPRKSISCVRCNPIDSFVAYYNWLSTTLRLTDQPDINVQYSGWVESANKVTYLYLHYKTYYDEYITFCQSNSLTPPLSCRAFQNEVLYKNNLVVLQQKISSDTYPRFEYRKTVNGYKIRCLKIKLSALLTLRQF